MNVNIETSHTEFLNILVSLMIVFISIFYRCFSQISIMFVWWRETLFACSYNRLTYKRIFFHFVEIKLSIGRFKAIWHQSLVGWSLTFYTFPALSLTLNLLNPNNQCVFALHSMEFQLRIPKYCGLFQHTLPVTPNMLVLLMTRVTVPIIKPVEFYYGGLEVKWKDCYTDGILWYTKTFHLQIPCFIVEEDERMKAEVGRLLPTTWMKR